MKYQGTIDLIRTFYPGQDFIPLHEPRFRGNEKKYLADTIDSTYVSSVGAYVGQFERMMSDLSETSAAVATVNGTSALQVGLRLLGVGAGDEVITQALTFVATANAIVYNGAAPVFIDVDLDTMGLSPVAVSEFLEEFGELRAEGCYNKKTGKRIAACMPMHTFGFPVHLDELLRVCETWAIPVIEDAAEALGSKYKGKPAGSFGKLGAFSFNGNKIVTCGGGGALVTNEPQLAERGRYLTTTAKRQHPYEFYHDELGYNFRMPNLNAALACAQLEQLQSFVAEKRLLAEAYQAHFKSTGINFRTEPEGTRANYWLMTVELDNRQDRDLFLHYFNAHQVMVRPIWALMFRLPMFAKCYADSQKNARYLEDRIVNIPSSVR